nr:hypothetical protein [Tanacetum cinerariifolium]
MNPIATHKPQREETYQVTLEALKLSPCYPAFVITAKICPRILNQDFIAPSSKEYLVTFIQELGYSSRYFMYEAENREISSARKEHMPCLRFTKVIINNFISKDKTISMRNMINLHTIRADSVLGTLKFISKTKDYQKYGVLIPDDMINQDIKDSQVYKTYYDFATGKGKRVKRHAKKSTTVPIAGVSIRDTLGVLDERQCKTFGTYEGTSTKLGVPDVPTYDFESENESWGDSEDDNDDDCDDKSKDDDDDKADNDDDGNSDADDSERIDSDDDDDENHSFTLKDYNEEEHDEEYEYNDDYENMFEEEDDDDLYKDVDVRSLGTEHEKERQGAEEMTDADQNTDDSKQSSSVSSDFASKFLILENVSPAIDEVASMMHVKIHQEESSTQAPSLFTVHVTAIPKTATVYATTISPTIFVITPPPQLTTPSSAPKTIQTTTLIHVLLDFSSLFGFDQRVSTLETGIALESYTKDFEKKAQEERKLYIDDVEKSVKDIIKDEFKSLLPHILPKEVSDFTTLVIQSTINESLKNGFLAKSSSQPNSTYEEAESLTEFELKKILLDKMERTYSLKRDREEKDKDEDPSTGSNRGLKKRKKSKVTKHQTCSKSKDSTSSSSKGTKSQPKSSGKSVQAEELVFETADTEMPQDQGKYVMHNLKIDNLTQDILNNPEGHGYPFDLSKPLPLIEAQGRQVVPADYFFNNDLKYLKEQDVIFDLNAALRMFSWCIVILKRVEDLQLGVESYQKKLNITKPETFKTGISKPTPYTAYKNPQGIIYQYKFKRNRLMDYLPKRRIRSRIMIKAIDQQLFERRLMRNLEKFTRGREYENDFRLLERTM